MVKITITVEGEPEEVRAALRQLVVSDTANQAEGVLTSGAVLEWTPDELRQLWNMIEPGARRILAALAERPDGYPFDALQQSLGMTGPNVAGRLSSVGHAMRRFPGKPHPVQRDYRTRQYTMDSTVAEAIQQLARDEEGASTET